LVATAVNVTEVPVQILLADADIEILTGRTGLTVIVIELDVAGLFVEHGTSEVNTQVT
jgi:hypothetical protein